MIRRKNKKESISRLPQVTSRPASVFSYHSSRSTNAAQTGRNPDPVRKEFSFTSWIIHAPTLVAGLAIAISVGYMLTLDVTPKFVPITDSSDNLLRSNEVYEREGRELFDDSVLSRLKLSIDTNKLATDISNRFPEFKSVSVIVPLFSRRPIVQIEPAQPAFILANQTGAYIVNSDGRAVLEALDAPSSVRSKLIQVTDAAQLELEEGKPVLPAATVAFITSVIHQLDAKDVKIKSVALPPAAKELYVYVADKPYYVKFDVEGDARLQSGTFISVKQHLEQGNRDATEYIDVRVAERAYVR